MLSLVRYHDWTLDVLSEYSDVWRRSPERADESRTRALVNDRLLTLFADKLSTSLPNRFLHLSNGEDKSTVAASCFVLEGLFCQRIQ